MIMATEKDAQQPVLRNIDAILSDRACSDVSDVNGEGSEHEGGQQWTQVGRSTNGRHNQKKKVMSSVPKETFPSNGHHDHRPFRSRSFRGPLDYGSSGRSTVNHMTRNRSSFHDVDRLANGHLDLDKSVTSDGKSDTNVKVDTTEVQNSVVSSPSPSISSGLQNVSESHDERLYCFQGRYQRGRRFYQPASEMHDSVNGAPTQFQPPLNTACTSAFISSTNRPPFGRNVCISAAPTGPTNQISQSVWRRPHSVQFGYRHAPLYYRYSSGVTHARPYHNRYRPFIEQPHTCDSQACITTTVNVKETPKQTTQVTPTVRTNMMTVDKPIPIGEQTTWAATVAATPRTETKKEQSTCTEPSRTQLAQFLLKQWQLYNQ